MDSPKPFMDDMIKPENRIWKPEPWDKYLPGPGFITDFVLATRGMETPTKFCVWSAIFTISSVLKRQTYYRWFPKPLYPNFFVFLVAPPKTGKSTAAEFGETLLMDYHQYIKSPSLRELKWVNLLRSKATPEALTVILQPQDEIPVQEGTKIKLVDRGSQTALVLSELSLFLGKQKYNTGLIDRLTHLYDCKESDDDATVTRGKQMFRDVYVTLIGATTQDHLEMSIPQEAFGGGLMSRVIVAFETGTHRDYPEPQPIAGGPGMEELKKRLAWVAETSVGEYTMESDAHKKYVDWYPHFKQKLFGELSSIKQKLEYRHDVHLLKLATIIRAQRYELGRNITLGDLDDAARILDGTFFDSHIGVSNVGAGHYTKWYNRVVYLFRKHKKLTRAMLLRSMSPYNCKAGDVSNIIQHLHQAGDINIKRKGEEVSKPSTYGGEVYRWIGGSVDE